MSDSSSWSVKLYMYDISKGMAKSLSQTFLGKHIEGVWHTGTVVYGREYFFGKDTGITSSLPGAIGQPDNILELGQTQIPKHVLMGYLEGLSKSTFNSEIVHFLTGKDLPSYITGFPAEIFSTPLGQMFKPMVDAVYVNPNGVQALFPIDSSSTTHSLPSTDTCTTDVPSQSRKGKGTSKRHQMRRK